MPTLNKKTILPEDILVKGLITKEKFYYEYLYDRYSGSLYGAILAIVRKEEIGEEILQDTFLKIWDKIDFFDASKGRLFTWMVNIARNLSRDKLRSKEMHDEKKTMRIEFYVGESVNHGSVEERIDGIGIREVLKRLPKEQEFVVEHLYLKGYTQAELAEEFQIPLGTVKTRLSLGLKKLQVLIKEN